MTIKTIVLKTAILAFSFKVFSLQQNFPLTPNPRITPGSRCTQAIEIRYPEKIAYCGRDVDSEVKEQIFSIYRIQLGYSFAEFDRAQYKIDHLIPLCMGGSNNINNLWPQHQSLFQITDRLEELLCHKISLGHLKQSQAIELMLRAKSNPKQAPSIFQYVSKL